MKLENFITFFYITHYYILKQINTVYYMTSLVEVMMSTVR